MIKKLNLTEKYFLLISFFLPVTLVVIFIAGRWPEYWKWIASEKTPMTSLQVTIMYTTALFCWANAAFRYVVAENIKSFHWFSVGSGFLWLAMDDRFAIHERIRDGFLKPKDISIPFLPVEPGDFILIFYMIVGLILLRWIIPLLNSRKAKKMFLTGVIVAAAAVILDAYNIHKLSLSGQRIVQSLEECIELLAQLFFLLAVISAFFESCRIKLNIDKTDKL